MSKDIADDILTNCGAWASLASATRIDFTYGVLYGTPVQSNKKDWHILRNIAERLPRTGTLVVDPTNQWHCEFSLANVNIDVTIRMGVELYNYIAGDNKAFMEICVALIRACIAPSSTQPADFTFTIVDLPDVISLDVVPPEYNVSLLQRSQIEWLFFVARHFCDELLSDDPTVGV